MRTKERLHKHINCGASRLINLVKLNAFGYIKKKTLSGNKNDIVVATAELSLISVIK